MERIGKSRVVFCNRDIIELPRYEVDAHGKIIESRSHDWIEIYAMIERLQIDSDIRYDECNFVL
jgi:hypothetical protein